MNIEDLRKEYYQVMGYTQPFGNEHHEELFNWVISKIETDQKKFNKEFTEQAIILDKYMSKCHELEQKLSACEIVLEDTQEKSKHLHNKIMVQWEKDFGSIHNEQNMDAYTVSGFVHNILGTDRQT